VVNDPENPHINYLRNPVRGVYELEKLMTQVKDRLKDVRDPALIIQGSDDPVVNPVSGREIYEGLGSERKQLIQINASHHGILRGHEARQVEDNVLRFLKDVLI
jgi:esterase/lipase